MLLAALVGLIPLGAFGAPEYRTEKAKRVLNTDRFSLSIRKNNRVDIHQNDGFPVVVGAYPSISIVEKTPRPLKVVYSKSSRVSIRNALGRGNGFQFETEECDWTIATYPGHPFITVALTYTNTGRNPVQVAALSPWDVGGKGKGTLFAGRQTKGPAVLMGKDGSSVPGTHLTHEEVESPGHIAVWNPGSREALVAGFLGLESHPTMLTVRDPSDSDRAVFGRFSAEMVYDPPITVAPGDSLKADLFYLSFGEQDVAAALERFIDGTRKMVPYPVLSQKFYRGWDAGARSDIDEESIRLVMDGLAGTAQQRGWGHVHLGTAWMETPTTLARDIRRFPQTFSNLTAHGRDRGLTVGLTIPIGVEDLDRTAAFIRQCQEAGFDSIELDAGRSLDAHTATRNLFQVLDGTRRPSPAIVSPLSPTPLPFDTIGLASRGYYLPVSGPPSRDSRHAVALGGLNDDQFITEVTRGALLGQPIRTAMPYSSQTPLRQAVLGRVSAAPTRTARPVDLLGDAPPEVWYLPLKSSAGAWTIAGLFNWSAAPDHIVQMPLERLGLNHSVRYTVYDYWAGQYLGLIKNTLKVEVPPDGVRLLGLRYAEQRPMLVASNRDYTQGATDQREITWDYDGQTLSGRMEGVGDFLHLLTFYIPEPYVLKSAEASETILTKVQDGPSLKIGFKPSLQGEIRWRLSF